MAGRVGDSHGCKTNWNDTNFRFASLKNHTFKKNCFSFHRKFVWAFSTSNQAKKRTKNRTKNWAKNERKSNKKSNKKSNEQQWVMRKCTAHRNLNEIWTKSERKLSENWTKIEQKLSEKSNERQSQPTMNPRLRKKRVELVLFVNFPAKNWFHPFN